MMLYPSIVNLLEKAGSKYSLVIAASKRAREICEVAEELGEDIATVFKTLVLAGDKTGHFVCVVPGDHEVDLKAVARLSGNKRADLIPMKELLPTTGYIRGGCSPIGMKRVFPTFIHNSCMEHERIYISAGVRGLQIAIAPKDLIAYTRATVDEISRRA